MRMFDYRRTLLSLAMALACAAPHGAGAQDAASQCGGKSMLQELAVTDPEAIANVLEHARTHENGQSLFWKIEKPGTPPSHLFGTMHLSDPRVTTIPAGVDEVLRQSSVVVLEVGDLSQNAIASAVAAGGRKLMFSEGTSLADKLTADDFAKVQAIVTASGMPVEFAPNLRPWLVSTLLSVSDCERRQVAAGHPVLDMFLEQRAKTLGLPVSGLESIQDQLESLASIPEDQQLQMLRVSLKYADRADDMLETMLQFYLKRQMGAAMPFQIRLANAIGVEASAFDGFQRLLLEERNARMSQSAQPLIDKGGAFIAVGALHLSGPKGLVALLREAGYSVTTAE